MDHNEMSVEDIKYFLTYDGMKLGEANSTVSYLMKFVGQTFNKDGDTYRISVAMVEGQHNEIMYLFRSIKV